MVIQLSFGIVKILWKDLPESFDKPTNLHRLLLAHGGENNTIMTGQYYYTICEPDNPKIIQMGDILKENILKIFDDFPWISYLRKMASMQEDAIHYSPSLEFGNRNNHTGIVFSIVGTEDEHEFYVFYKRPKTVQQSLGLFKHDMKEYISDIMDQSMEDARQILIAFVNDDTLYLEEKMKKQ